MNISAGSPVTRKPGTQLTWSCRIWTCRTRGTRGTRGMRGMRRDLPLPSLTGTT